MHASHDLRLVALSVVIAALASYAALDLADRTHAARGRGRTWWLLGGALAMGTGIWSMHFIGMLAFRLAHHAGAAPLALGYDLPLLALSGVFAVGASALALGTAARAVLGAGGLTAGALLLGGAIAGMHYLGMAAMRMDAALRYEPALVVASLAIAGGAAAAALWLARRLRGADGRRARLAKGAAAAVMGVAIAGMHYTGMAAARFTPADLPLAAGHVVATTNLAYATTVMALVVLVATLLGAATDRAYEARVREIVRDGEARLRLALDAASLSVWEWDAAGDRLRTLAHPEPRGAGAARGGRDTAADEVTGAAFFERVHPDDRPRLAAVVAGATSEEQDIEVEYRTLEADGAERWRHARGQVVRVENGRPVQILGVVMDVTDRKQLEADLAHQAFHDPLTGLANRVLFRDRVAHALALAPRRASQPVIIFLDLDNFKAVNDGFGHAAGDRLLREVARRLAGCLRASDTCARLGGDEFAVLLEQVDASIGAAADAARVAERIVEALRAPIMVERTAVCVGASLGIAVAAPDDSEDTLLRNADVAMYRAKGGGKGRYQLFEPAMHEAVRERLALEAELRQALEDPARSLVLHYQPIAALDSGEVVGFEALLRWQHPERGLVPPGAFIPVAEESGLIVGLGRWVLREACRQTAAWNAARPSGAAPLSISVNLSVRQLAMPDLPDLVAAALADAALPAACLTLELTESMLVDRSEPILDCLWALRGLGVALAIDDFGTGYSSLSYLERLPVDVLKIDKAFVDRIGEPGTEAPLARAILGLGSALGMRVVAEGIETPQQWEGLGRLGCELGQGYFIGRPQPATDAERRIELVGTAA